VQLAPEKEGTQPDQDSSHSSESGSITPKAEPRKPLIHDERVDKPEKAGVEAEVDTQVKVQALQDQPVEESVPVEDRPVEDVTGKPRD